MNTFGKIFTLTTFGESHGPAIGGVVDGMPAGINIDMDFVQAELDRRRPGTSALVTSRNEPDRVRFLSGIFEGQSTGAPIGFVIENTNQHSADYDNMRAVYRPSHADYTYDAKYGLRDHRGGGRSSARVTAARVVAGALAKLALRLKGISISSLPMSVGSVHRDADTPDDVLFTDAMQREILAARADGDTVGGVIQCTVCGCPPGLGEPEAGKLHAMLGAAMLSINAAKGFEYGMGFAGAEKRGSQVADLWHADASDARGFAADTNWSGGIQGGISNGEDIVMRVAFKPVATLLRDVNTVDNKGNDTVLHARGRHDPCVLPRALVIVEAMAAITVLDACLMAQTTRLQP